MGNDDIPDGWGEDPEDFADAETHLSDEDYDAFIASAFDEDGNARGAPPVGWVILLIGLALVVLLYLKTR